MGRIAGFIIGIILFVGSLPVGGIMFIEYVHDKKMDMRYQFMDISQGYPPTSPKYMFHNQEIMIEETPIAKQGYTDAWQNEMVFSDFVFKVNGKEIDRLSAYPVREHEEGLNRYFGNIAYFLVKDKKIDETSFILALKRTNETSSTNSNGDIVGLVPENELKYTYHKVNHAGDVLSNDFGYADRDGFETKLLTKGHLASTAVGYYTDLWHGYPSLFFPFLYPLLTIVIGGILIIHYRPFWRKKRIP